MKPIKNNIISKKIKVGYLKYIIHPYQGFYFRRKAQLAGTDILLNKKYNLGLVAIFRGEDDYLIEWIEFHKLMGVDHFILYDNGCSDESFNLLKKYIDEGLITYIEFPHIEGTRDGRYSDTISTQQLAYADCIIRFKHHFNYLMQLDIDEFLFPKDHNNITEVLNELNGTISRIDVNWTNFGSSSHIEKPAGLVIENFKMAAKTVDPNTVKSIVNTKFLSSVFKYSNVHRFSIKYSFKDKLKRIFFKKPRVLNGDESNNLFQLNHYITKSKEEFLKRGVVYKDGWQIGKKTEERFNYLDEKYNQVLNDNIQRFIKSLPINT